MGSSASTSPGQQGMVDSNVVDFDEIVKIWVRDVIPKRLSTKSNTVYDINWNMVRIKTDTPTYHVSKDRTVVRRSKSSIGNDTENVQDNEVIVEGKYTATTSVTLSKTFTMKEQTRLTLCLPNEKVNTVFDETMNITKIDRETIKKEQTWKVVTKVTVPPGEKRTVKQTVNVNNYSSTFSVASEISGMVKVTVYKKTGNDKVFLMSLDPKNIVDIMKYVKGKKNRLIPHKFVEILKSSVRVTTEGKCEFSYGVEHDVNTTPYEEEEEEVDDDEGEVNEVIFGTPHVSYGY